MLACAFATLTLPPPARSASALMWTNRGHRPPFDGPPGCPPGWAGVLFSLHATGLAAQCALHYVAVSLLPAGLLLRLCRCWRSTRGRTGARRVFRWLSKSRSPSSPMPSTLTTRCTLTASLTCRRRAGQACLHPSCECMACCRPDVAQSPCVFCRAQPAAALAAHLTQPTAAALAAHLTQPTATAYCCRWNDNAFELMSEVSPAIRPRIRPGCCANSQRWVGQ